MTEAGTTLTGGFEDSNNAFKVESKESGIPRFSPSGAVLTEDERRQIATRRGLCYPCGRKTHKIRPFGKTKALNNEDVCNGICLVCYPEMRPGVGKSSSCGALPSRGGSNSSLGSTGYSKRRAPSWAPGVSRLNIDDNGNPKPSFLDRREQNEKGIAVSKKTTASNENQSPAPTGSSARSQLGAVKENTIESPKEPSATTVSPNVNESLDSTNISHMNHINDKNGGSSRSVLSGNSGTLPKTNTSGSGNNPSESRAMSNHEPTRRDSAIEAGYIGDGMHEEAWDILQTIKNNPALASVLIKSFKLLSKQAEIECENGQPFPDESIPVITKAMARHPRNGEVQEFGCLAIKNLILAQPTLVKAISFEQLLTRVFVPMQNLPDDAMVQKQACAVLHALTGDAFNDSTECLNIMFKDLLDLITLYTGDGYPSDPGLLYEAFGAMEGITSLAKLHSLSMSRSDVDSIISIIYMTMEYAPDRTDILELVLDVMLHIASDSDDLVVSCGGAVAVLDVMKEKQEVEGIQAKGIANFARLSKTNSEAKRLIVETEGLDLIISAMFTYPTNRLVQIEACRAFSYLSDDITLRTMIASGGGIMLVVTGMTNFNGDYELREVGCAALVKLSPDDYEQVLSDANLL